jgi:hypothetical protein
MSPLPGFSLEERFENRDVSRTVHLYAINKDNSEHWYPLYRDADGRLLVSAKLDGFYEGELVYGEQATVPDNTETTIVSYVNSELSAVWFQGFVGTGNVDAQYKLYINTNLKMRYRTVGGIMSNEIKDSKSKKLEMETNLPKVKKELTKISKGESQEVEHTVEVTQGNVELVQIRLLSAINNNLIAILKTLRGGQKVNGRLAKSR